MRPNLTIDEMAIKQLLAHKNDKSDRWLARMNGRFGRAAADEAIERNRDILVLCGALQPLPKFVAADWEKDWSTKKFKRPAPPRKMWFDELA